jgi:hypothetical protein
MSPKPSDHTFALLFTAMQEIAADASAPRTKAYLGRVAKLAHPTVHRAFAWDSKNETEFRLNEMWNALTAGSERRSPDKIGRDDLEAQLKQARTEIAALRLELEAARLAVAAAWATEVSGGTPSKLVSIPRRTE